MEGELPLATFGNIVLARRNAVDAFGISTGLLLIIALADYGQEGRRYA